MKPVCAVLTRELLPAGMQVPGNIRRAEHFVAFLRRFVAYLKEKLGVNQVETENPTTFLAQLQERLNIDGMQPLIILNSTCTAAGTAQH